MDDTICNRGISMEKKIKFVCRECGSIYKEVIGVRSSCPVCVSNQVESFTKKSIISNSIKAIGHTPNISKIRDNHHKIKLKFPNLNDKQISVLLGYVPLKNLSHNELLELDNFKKGHK